MAASREGEHGSGPDYRTLPRAGSAVAGGRVDRRRLQQREGHWSGESGAGRSVSVAERISLAPEPWR